MRNVDNVVCYAQKHQEMQIMQCVTLRNVVCYMCYMCYIVLHSEMQCVTLRNVVCYTQKYQKSSVLHAEISEM